MGILVCSRTGISGGGAGIQNTTLMVWSHVDDEIQCTCIDDIWEYPAYQETIQMVLP